MEDTSGLRSSTRPAPASTVEVEVKEIRYIALLTPYSQLFVKRETALLSRKNECGAEN